MTAILHTKDGDVVAFTISPPAGEDIPDILEWGDRLFVVDVIERSGDVEYREAFAWALPPTGRQG